MRSAERYLLETFLRTLRRGRNSLAGRKPSNLTIDRVRPTKSMFIAVHLRLKTFL